jgi:putative salt-induced outer membrane protein
MMSLRTATATLIALTALGASPVFAQNVFTGVDAVDDRIDDIQEDTADALDSDDEDRFGFGRAPQGWAGSFALSADASSGNTESFDVAGAARLTYGAGAFTNYMGLGIEYSEDDNQRDVAEAFAIYDGVYDFGNDFYAFGTARYNYDDFASFRHDAFIGAGPGYRIFNTDDLAWRVQAGPGFRYLEDQDANETTELAGIASSRFFYRFSDTAFMTNDTDLLGSDESINVYNDLGVNFRMTNVLSTRVYLQTDWTDDPAPGFDEFDNSVGLALVASF